MSMKPRSSIVATDRGDHDVRKAQVGLHAFAAQVDHAVAQADGVSSTFSSSSWNGSGVGRERT